MAIEQASAIELPETWPIKLGRKKPRHLTGGALQLLVDKDFN